MRQQVVLRKGIFDRWILVNPRNDREAWSGTRWVAHIDGLPAEQVQICNFDSEEEASEYARKHGMQRIP